MHDQTKGTFSKLRYLWVEFTVNNMRHRIILALGTLLLFSFSFSVSAQQNIFANKAILAQVKLGIDKTYNSEFDQAEAIFRMIGDETPGHPVGPLLFGLLYYYKYSPLTPESEGAGPFVATLEKAISLSGKILDKDKNNVEIMAIDMISRALLNMYYVDNGNSFKAIPEVMPIYRYVVRGFKLKDQFNEFYFTTGLYNYYREAYPEAHPVYKPVASLLQPGNKAEGLRELHYAADSCIFLKNEALIFLKIIYLNYENDPVKASRCMQSLHDRYPNNLDFMAGCAETYLFSKEYEKARPFLYLIFTRGRKNKGALMKGFILKGMYEEKAVADLPTAEQNYLTGLQMSEDFGSPVDAYRAYACFGLSRIYKIEGKLKESKEYRKKAESLARYKYFSRLD